MEAFLALTSQWRLMQSAMGPVVWLGIDYTAIPPVFDLLGVAGERRRELFGDLRVMEAAARVELNRKGDGDG